MLDLEPALAPPGVAHIPCQHETVLRHPQSGRPLLQVLAEARDRTADPPVRAFAIQEREVLTATDISREMDSINVGATTGRRGHSLGPFLQVTQDPLPAGPTPAPSPSTQSLEECPRVVGVTWDRWSRPRTSVRPQSGFAEAAPPAELLARPCARTERRPSSSSSKRDTGIQQTTTISKGRAHKTQHQFETTQLTNNRVSPLSQFWNFWKARARATKAKQRPHKCRRSEDSDQRHHET